MARSHLTLGLICLGALLLRLALLPGVPHPGIADPTHYYQVGQALVAGRGFTLDFIWQYNNPPADIVHEMDYWNPLAGVVVAAGFVTFGQQVAGGVLPFALMGALLPLLAYSAARQLDLSQEVALFAAACTACLPELLLHSLRTETTTPAALLGGSAVLLLGCGLRRHALWAWLLAGLCAGLAYLVRSDAALLLPMLLGVLVLRWLAARWRPDLDVWPRHTLAYAALAVGAALLVIAPWLLRNQVLFGTPTTPHLSYMFFLTHHDEHFAYDDVFTLETLLASQSLGQIVGKRLFELAAAAKVMWTSLEGFLPVAVWGGLLLLILRRDAQRLLRLSPVLILLLALLVFYPILIPMKAQGGSFKKAFLACVPLLLPLAGCALQQAIPAVALRRGVMVLVVGVTAAFAVDAVRLDMQFVREYMAYTEHFLATFRTLPDVTGDGVVRLMNQDPFMMSYYGVQAVMTPRDDRDAVLAVARRYQIDYLMAPTARPALDAVVWWQTEVDVRFQLVARVPRSDIMFYTFAYDR